jgi:hypothetical protein
MSGVGSEGVVAVVQARTLYSSANGDRWELVREPGSGRVFVRHRPNAASGGRASEIEVGEFLTRGGGQGPEHQELLRLIGTLVADGPAAAAHPLVPAAEEDEEAAGAAR